MANVNQTLVTNFLATPQVMNDPDNLHGVMRVACGTIALAAGDLSAGDTIMLAPIPTNAAVVSIKIYNDDLDSGTTVTMHVGLYTADGNVTVKDADAYASATTDLRAAVLTGTEVAFEARNVNTMGQKVWQDAGDSSDPGGYYLIGLETDAAGDTAGDLSFLITYIVN
jgi:sulfate adenylyltransferase subunit 1 (EFTu-like GTPase family)